MPAEIFYVNYNLLSLSLVASLLVQVIIEKESSVYVADGKVCKNTILVGTWECSKAKIILLKIPKFFFVWLDGK